MDNPQPQPQPGPTEKVLCNKRSIHISGSQLNIIALVLDFWKYCLK